MQIVDNSTNPLRWYGRKINAWSSREAQLVPWTFVLVPGRQLFPFFSKSRRLNTGTTKVESRSSRTAGLCYLRSAIRVLSNAAFTVAYTPARIPFSLLPNPIGKTLVSFTWLVPLWSTLWLFNSLIIIKIIPIAKSKIRKKESYETRLQFEIRRAKRI